MTHTLLFVNDIISTQKKYLTKRHFNSVLIKKKTFQRQDQDITSFNYGWYKYNDTEY